MRRAKNFFVLIFASFFLLLAGCDLFPTTSGSNSESSGASDSTETLDTFEFVTDDKLVFKSVGEYYSLTLYAGESYQVKTTVDDSLGDDYYLKYTVDEETAGKFTISESGYIEIASSLNESESFVINAELYKKGVSKKIERKYCALSLRVGDYARVSLTNEGLEYDDSTCTYSLSMDSGESYKLSYSISYNTPYVLSFSLTDSSYADFMSVDENGYITTVKTSEDKVGEISVTTTGSGGVLDMVFVKVSLAKSEGTSGGETQNLLTVINTVDASEVVNGATIELYQGQALSFDVRYNNQSKTNVITAADASVLEVSGATNTVKGIKLGESEIVFAYAEEQITVTVNVIKDKLVSLSAENEGNDFVIINGTLYYLNNLYAAYQSGAKKEITDSALLATDVFDKDETHKTVEFTYAEDGESAKIAYDVKYYVTEEYSARETAYDNNDYFNNYYIGKTQVLPSKGTVKLLAIPVWFNDSDLFFTKAQQAQMLEDVEYTVKGNRPDSELKSVKQYYEAQSYGALTMDITVSDAFYCSPTSYEDYTDNIEEKLTNVYDLGTSAISWYFESHTNESLEDYDLNGDGYLDGLLLYYGANWYGASGDKNRSIAFEVNNNDNHTYSFNTMAFCPLGGLYGLEKKDPAEQLKVDDLSVRYRWWFDESARTMIHEVGHMFGNVDLYEDQFSTERYAPAGGFSMQEDDYGSLDPYHVNRIGWSKPQVYASSDYKLGDTVTLRLSDFQSSGQNIILANKWNEANSLYDEYLILEMFAPTGLNFFDAQIRFRNTIQSGIRVWHVNSVLTKFYDENKTSAIVDGESYLLAYNNHNVSSECDVLHMIRNNPNEAYHTTSKIQNGEVLFEQGDSFDMETFQSQFINGSKLDNGEKLGWAFTVDAIYRKADGTYDAVITLERTDNVRTEFSKTVTLNRDDLSEPSGENEYGDELFGAGGGFSLLYKYVTPPSVYVQDYPISSNGMCLFASADGNGGYIDVTIKDVDGKEVCITSVSVVYSYLTNATPTVLVGGVEVAGTQFTPESDKTYGYTYAVNGKSVRIQNRYDGTIDHWSVLPLYEITIHYTIK